MEWLLSGEEVGGGHWSDYAHLGLRDNPFPVDGIINRTSPDPRINGSIFSVEIRQEIIREFETKLLGVGNPEQRYRLGYFWSQGDQAFGRGVGKTAILTYLQNRINHGWGKHYFHNNYPVCALYIYPQPEMNKLEYVAVLALQELVNQKVIEGVLTALRHQVAQDNWVSGNSQAVKELKPSEANLLLDENWLREQDFDLIDLQTAVSEYLVSAGVDESFATAIASNKLIEYLKSMRKDGQLTFRAPPRDLILYRKANQLFFSQSIRTLKAAGFRGMYLFVDDLENMVDKMSRREREAFAKELGYILLRGEYEAGVSRFITLVLTTHAAAAQKLSEAWGLAGLQSSLPMSLDAPNSILVSVLSTTEAKEIIKRYLSSYQLVKSKNGKEYHPFTEEAVELLIEHSNHHPREFLAKAHYLIEQARQNSQLAELTRAFVQNALLSLSVQRTNFEDVIDISLL